MALHPGMDAENASTCELLSNCALPRYLNEVEKNSSLDSSQQNSPVLVEIGTVSQESVNGNLMYRLPPPQINQ